MTHYKLKCDCGYASNPVPFGSDAWSNNFYVPVVVGDNEKLQKLKLVKLENESEDEFDNRIDTMTQSIATEIFGANATTMTPLAVRGDQIVQCPRCKENTARFEFVGF